MDQESITASAESTMKAKLIGIQENHSRPRPQLWPVYIERTGVSKPTQCLFLAADGSLKWVAVNAGVFPGDWSFKSTSHLVFPPFPTGTWNVGQIRRREDGEVAVTKTLEMTDLEGIKNTWHPTNIDFAEFAIVGQSKANGRLWTAKHPRFNDKLVFVKIDPWLTDVSRRAMETETRAYQLIDGLGIAPNFLGHVTYYGAVIGFILEWVEGAYNSEKADQLDRLAAIKKLHALGISHGSAHHENFLKIGKDILIIDFESSRFGDRATDEWKKRDIQRISDFDMDMWDIIPAEDVDEYFYPKALESKFFDDMEDDWICWTDDSEAGYSGYADSDDSAWETVSDSEDGESSEDDNGPDSNPPAPMNEEVVEQGDKH
ncbi:hypothetical protein O1611_g4037 [Lasiodiplodia mahajangana]|uniref:Uncharacterized protein n=1 Tax=Lasiodiplodia mahajangana TaxID=1108764 RepID=A0ACC2JQF7_9PEZI|nr:hypothetical protein O1611_g4037 [Lasiodiplodia mahajangana]